MIFLGFALIGTNKLNWEGSKYWMSNKVYGYIINRQEINCLLKRVVISVVDVTYLFNSSFIHNHLKHKSIFIIKQFIFDLMMKKIWPTF